MEIDTPRGELVIEADRTAPDAGYIRRMTLGGKRLGKYRISHDELLSGGHLTFELESSK